HLKLGGHHLDRLKQLVVEPANILHPGVVERVGKDEGRDPFLSDDRATSVLISIHGVHTSSFAPEIPPCHRGPAKDSCAREVKDIVEAIAVLLMDVIIKFLPHLLPIDYDAN